MSYIMRKPEPLWTKFKCIVDGLGGGMLWREIMEGKERMARKEYQNFGGTTACVMRGVMPLVISSSSLTRMKKHQKMKQYDHAFLCAIAGLDLPRAQKTLVSVAIIQSQLSKQLFLDHQKNSWKKP